jgi:O-antigen ligase
LRTLPTTPARYLRLVPLLAAAGLGAYGLLRSAGVLGVVLFAAILFFTGALVAWTRQVDAEARNVIAATANGALLCAPALLVVFFSFDSGGFFPDSVALGDIALAALLVIRLGLAERPLAAFGRRALVPLFGLAGLAGWALLSQFWSHAPGRATIAFDRDLLYALTFALFASVGGTRERITWALRAVALAMVAVAAVALLSRVAPDILVTAPDPQANGRLAYPLTYWNALGIFCAVAGLLCLHLAAADERRLIRVLSAAALPVIGAALLLTYSRGGLAAAVIGLAAYAVLARPRGLLSALVAAGPATAVAMKAAYDSTLLSGPYPTSAAAVHQGHHLALIVVACVAAAVVLRLALLRLDRLLEGEHSPIDRHRRALRGTALGALVVAIAIALALGAPSTVANRWNQFANQAAPPASALVRNRLSSTSNDGRIQLWTVALNAFRAHPLDGTGADTFEISYYESHSAIGAIVNAHSLYIETLGELGIVGLVLVLLFVLGTLAGLAPFRRGRDRALYGALFSAGLAWALHAGVEWDWQMPAASLWFAALGGLVLGRADSRATSSLRAVSLTAFAAGAVVVAVTVFPALVLGSQIRLNEASSAYAAGDCTRADTLARDSIDVLGTRAPPWQIVALCAARSGDYRQASTDLRAGLAVDPNDWQLQAALAATTAAVGDDARAQVRAALALDPLEPTVVALAQALERGPSAKARRAGLNYLSQQVLITSG